MAAAAMDINDQGAETLAVADFQALEERVLRAVELLKAEREAHAAATAKVEELQRHSAELERQLTTRPAMNDTSQGVTVEIYDQPYHLRGQDPVYIERLANLVDTKMRAVAAQGTTVDSLRVAVLAAINIADELMTLQARYRNVNQAENTLRTRASNLNGLLDSVLTGERRTG